MFCEMATCNIHTEMKSSLLLCTTIPTSLPDPHYYARDRNAVVYLHAQQACHMKHSIYRSCIITLPALPQNVFIPRTGYDVRHKIHIVLSMSNAIIQQKQHRAGYPTLDATSVSYLRSLFSEVQSSSGFYTR